MAWDFEEKFFFHYFLLGGGAKLFLAPPPPPPPVKMEQKILDEVIRWSTWNFILIGQLVLPLYSWQLAIAVAAAKDLTS